MSASRPLAVLAEDDSLIRMEAADMLGVLGFEVLEAGDAAQALSHLEANPGVALLYTDLRMPGRMDGGDLVRCVAKRWPRIRIIVCSGCTREEAERLPSCTRFIAKPCVEQVVRRALQALHLY